METAEFILGNKRILPSISIYHSHQCVEKMLKAVLASNKESIPKIHNLSFLLKKSITYYPKLIRFEDNCAELNILLPKLRYPVEEQLTQIDATICLKIAKEIYKYIADLL